MKSARRIHQDVDRAPALQHGVYHGRDFVGTRHVSLQHQRGSAPGPDLGTDASGLRAVDIDHGHRCASAGVFLRRKA